MDVAFWGDDIGTKGWKWARERAFHAEGQQGNKVAEGNQEEHNPGSNQVILLVDH